MPVEECYQRIGRNIALWRNTRGLTQTELGEYIGQGYASINRMENGDQRIMLHTVEELAVALRVKPDMLTYNIWEAK